MLKSSSPDAAHAFDSLCLLYSTLFRGIADVGYAVKDMLAIGKDLIGDDSETIFGFHLFPFISVGLFNEECHDCLLEAIFWTFVFGREPFKMCNLSAPGKLKDLQAMIKSKVAE